MDIPTSFYQNSVSFDLMIAGSGVATSFFQNSVSSSLSLVASGVEEDVATSFFQNSVSSSLSLVASGVEEDVATSFFQNSVSLGLTLVASGVEEDVVMVFFKNEARSGLTPAALLVSLGWAEDEVEDVGEAEIELTKLREVERSLTVGKGRSITGSTGWMNGIASFFQNLGSTVFFANSAAAVASGMEFSLTSDEIEKGRTVIGT